MKKLWFIILLSVFLCLSFGIPVIAADSIDKQIRINMVDGIQAYEEERYEDALQYLGKVVELDPNNICIWYLKSTCNYYLKNYDASMSDLDTALRLNPKNYKALYDKACFYSLKNNPNQALENLQKLLMMDGNFKAAAINDKDFDNIRELAQFKTVTGISILIDGEALESDTAPMVVAGRTLVSLRAIFEALGAEVNWDAENQEINCKQGSSFMILQIDNSDAMVNGKAVKLDTPAIINNSRAYVPLRFAVESLGSDVQWVPQTKQVYITTKEENSNTLAADENQIMESLKEKLDYLPVESTLPNPYYLPKTQCLAMLVAKSQEDLLAFQSLGDENQKAFLNDYIQDDWGSYIGCEKVTIYFIFNGKRYAETATDYTKKAADLTIYKFKKGIETNVVIQDKDNGFFYDYYVNKKPIFNKANSEKHQISENLVPYDIYFYNSYLTTIGIPDTWEIEEYYDEVYFYAPPDDDNDTIYDSIGFYVDKFPPEMMGKLNQPESLIEFMNHEVKQNLPELKMITAEHLLKEGKVNSYLFEYTCRAEDNDIHCTSVVYVREDGFTLYCEVAAGQKDFERYNEIFEAVMSTMKSSNPSDLL